MTVAEVLIAASISLVIVGACISFSRFQAIVWSNNSGDFSTQKQATTAMQRLTPSIRKARSVVIASSSATRLTLQLPAYDAGGSLIVPIQNGQVVSYYLSDTTGSTSASGNILWRSVNGTPDSAWSLASGRGRVVLNASGLSFTYVNAADPESVIVRIDAAATVNSDTSRYTTSQEAVLRNHGVS